MDGPQQEEQGGRGKLFRGAKEKGLVREKVTGWTKDKVVASWRRWRWALPEQRNAPPNTQHPSLVRRETKKSAGQATKEIYTLAWRKIFVVGFGRGC